jgi:hypothetical protein
MLEITRHGRLAECLDAALNVIESPHERDDIRQYAAMAIRAIDNKIVRGRLRQIVSNLHDVPNRLCALIIEILYPNDISPTDLVKLLAKTAAVREFGLDLPSQLKSHLESALLPKDAGGILKELLVLAQREPFTLHGEKIIPISEQFYWVGQIIPTILEKLFDKIVLSPDETDTAAEALALLGHVRECHRDFSADDVVALNNLSLKQPSVRQNYFWRIVAAFRNEHNEEPTMSVQLFDHWEVLKLSPRDFPWLIEDIGKQKVANDRALALQFAVEAWHEAGRTFAGRWQLRGATKCDPALRAVYCRSILAGPFFPMKRFWYQKVRSKYGKWWWMRKLDLAHLGLQWIRDQLFLWRNLRLIESGKPVGWLHTLAREGDRFASMACEKIK